MKKITEQIKKEITDDNFVYQIYWDGHLEIYDFYDGRNYKMLSIPSIKILQEFLNSEVKND